MTSGKGEADNHVNNTGGVSSEKKKSWVHIIRRTMSIRYDKINILFLFLMLLSKLNQL